MQLKVVLVYVLQSWPDKKLDELDDKTLSKSEFKALKSHLLQNESLFKTKFEIDIPYKTGLEIALYRYRKLENGVFSGIFFYK